MIATVEETETTTTTLEEDVPGHPSAMNEEIIETEIVKGIARLAMTVIHAAAAEATVALAEGEAGHHITAVHPAARLFWKDYLLR